MELAVAVRGEVAEVAVASGASAAGEVSVRRSAAGSIVASSFTPSSSVLLLKPGTIDEAAAQRDLRKLPSLGASTAAKLIALGFRTLQQLKDDADAGGKSRELLTEVQLSCLEFHEDLTGKVTAEEVAEMEAAVLAAARVSKTTADDAKWEVIPVGGGRRSDASHDADFLLTHPDMTRQSQLRGVLRKVVLRLGPKIVGGDGWHHAVNDVNTLVHLFIYNQFPSLTSCRRRSRCVL